MKRLNKALLSIASLLIIINTFNISIKADDDIYEVADVSSGKKEVIDTFSSYNSANSFYRNNVDEYDNLVLYENDKVMKMEYGVVEFVTDDTCSLNIEYRSTIKNTSSSINGCYGKDGAYLYTSNNGNTVYFKVSDDIGYTSIDDVILHPYDLLDVRVSSYANIDGLFYHQIKTQLQLDYYSSALPIDLKLDYLEDNKNYYSYDGHYFYDDFKVMIDDYNNDTYENSINHENPYYNYYQYLSLRSLTNYDYSEIESYFYNSLMIKDKIYYYDDQVKDGANDVVNRSQYYDELASFIEYQNIYGVNALNSIAIANLESSYGKNYNSFITNNLYNHVAYDSDEERNNNRYESISDSIYSHDKYYISDRYSNYRSSNYYGTYLGNKLSGINVTYSLDPYWGEKVASNYFQMDNTMGLKDYKSYAIGIIKGGGRINFYNNENLSSLKFRVSGIDTYSLIILEDLGDAYKVQVDPSFNSDYKYDFDESVAYVSKNYFDLIINEDKIHNNDLLNVTYLYNDNTTSVKVLNGTTSLMYNTLALDGYVIESIEKTDEDNTYNVSYKKIESIEINNPIVYTIEQDSYLDLRDSSILVNYEDGSKEELPINTNMVSSIDTSKQGEQDLTITYHGVSTSTTINVSKELKDLHNKISELIDTNIDSYKNDGTYNSEDIKEIKENLSKVDYVYDFSKTRQIDAILLDEYRRKAYYTIDENKYDLSISGLTLCLADKDITSDFKLFPDTYYVHVKEINADNKETLENLANSYGFEVIDYLSISYSLNMNSIDQEGAVVVSVKPTDKQTNKIYTVYRLDENGDIVKCKTTQTNNYIQFLTKKSGSFAILAKDSVNNYDLPDTYENITSFNSDPNYFDLFIFGSFTAVVIIYGFICILIYLNNNKKIETKTLNYRKTLLEKIK